MESRIKDILLQAGKKQINLQSEHAVDQIVSDIMHEFDIVLCGGESTVVIDPRVVKPYDYEGE